MHEPMVCIFIIGIFKRRSKAGVCFHILFNRRAALDSGADLEAAFFPFLLFSSSTKAALEIP